MLINGATATAADASELPPDHPILGGWSFEVPHSTCVETYIYRSNGTTLVTSAREVAESRYHISSRARPSGFFKMEDRIVQGNGRPDCGGGVSRIGSRITRYILFDANLDMMVMCVDESLDRCIGPLRRLPGASI